MMHVSNILIYVVSCVHLSILLGKKMLSLDVEHRLLNIYECFYIYLKVCAQHPTMFLYLPCLLAPLTPTIFHLFPVSLTLVRITRSMQSKTSWCHVFAHFAAGQDEIEFCVEAILS